MNHSAPVMGKSRLEAFSDGVIAILITIMVLELKMPHEPTLAALTPVLPVFLAYLLSYVYLGIYWVNHHHMLHACERVSGPILWANLHLLFWLSLVPFVTAFVGEHHHAPMPVALYGGVLLCAALSYTILQQAIIRSQGEESLLRRAVGRDVKGKASLVAYVVALAAAAPLPQLSLALYVLVALLWVVPDRRVERVLGA